MLRWSGIALLICSVLSNGATGEELVLFGAGSLREVMTRMATDYQTAYGVTVHGNSRSYGETGLRIPMILQVLIAMYP